MKIRKSPYNLWWTQRQWDDDRCVHPLKSVDNEKPAVSKHLQLNILNSISHLISKELNKIFHFIYEFQKERESFVIVREPWPIQEGKMLSATIIVLFVDKATSLHSPFQPSTDHVNPQVFIMRRENAANVKLDQR